MPGPANGPTGLPADQDGALAAGRNCLMSMINTHWLDFCSVPLQMCATSRVSLLYSLPTVMKRDSSLHALAQSRDAGTPTNCGSCWQGWRVAVHVGLHWLALEAACRDTELFCVASLSILLSPSVSPGTATQLLHATRPVRSSLTSQDSSLGVHF